MSFTIPWVKPHFTGREEKLVLEALHSTWISGGPFVNQLEAQFAERLGVKSATCVSNGTTALNLALLGLGIGAGDEVIIPNFTFVAPGNMIVAVGARPVFADIDPDTWLLDPNSIEKLITKNTKAIIAVHLYGGVCDMPKIMQIAKKHSIPVIEDTAEATFSKVEGRYAGTWGDIGSFSFHATKTLTTGEGGCVVTNNPELAAKMRLIRDHGMNTKKRYWHEVIGHNFRMTNIQAAIGVAQMERINDAIEARAEIYTWYRTGLEGLPLRMQKFPKGVDRVVWTVTVELVAKEEATRDQAMRALAEKGIEVRPGFYPFSIMPPFKEFGGKDLNVSLEVASRTIALPFFVGLKKTEVEYICATLKEILCKP